MVSAQHPAHSLLLPPVYHTHFTTKERPTLQCGLQRPSLPCPPPPFFFPAPEVGPVPMRSLRTPSRPLVPPRTAAFAPEAHALRRFPLPGGTAASPTPRPVTLPHCSPLSLIPGPLRPCFQPLVACPQPAVPLLICRPCSVASAPHFFRPPLSQPSHSRADFILSMPHHCNISLKIEGGDRQAGFVQALLSSPASPDVQGQGRLEASPPACDPCLQFCSNILCYKTHLHSPSRQSRGSPCWPRLGRRPCRAGRRRLLRQDASCPLSRVSLRQRRERQGGRRAGFGTVLCRRRAAAVLLGSSGCAEAAEQGTQGGHWTLQCTRAPDFAGL